MRIAVLGMGQMGRALAGRLLDAGHAVPVWNRTPGRADELLTRGATECATAGEAAEGADVVMASLTDDRAARAVLAPDDAPLQGVGSGAVVVDCSSVSPDTTRFLAHIYDGRFAAAPIMGSPDALANGTAALAIAGPPAVLDRLDPAWSAIGDHVRRCGDDPGRALVVKLVNNFLLLSGIAALAEAVAVAQSAGLEDDLLRDLLGSSPLVAAGLQNRLENIIERRHAGWFPTPLGAKDMGLFGDLARSVGLTLPLADSVRGRYLAATQNGLAEADIGAVVNLYPR